MKALNKTIRKNLLETKENQKSMLVEQTIIRNRYNHILESFKQEENLTIEKVFFPILKEMIKLRELNLNESVLLKEEANFFSMITSLFGGAGLESLKEYGVKWILEKIDPDFANDIWGQFIVKGVGNLGFSDIPKLFTDCNFTSRWIAESLVEGFIGRYQEKEGYGGFFADTIRNAVFNSLEKNELISAVSNMLTKTVCSLIGKLGDKMGDTYDKVKEKVITT